MAFGNGPYPLVNKNPSVGIIGEFEKEEELVKKYGYRMELIAIPWAWYQHPTDPWSERRVKKVGDKYKIHTLHRYAKEWLHVATMHCKTNILQLHTQGNNNLSKLERTFGFRILAPRGKKYEHNVFRWNHHVHEPLYAKNENEYWWRVRIDKDIFIDCKSRQVFQKAKLKERTLNKTKARIAQDNFKQVNELISKLLKLTNLREEILRIVANTNANMSPQEGYNKLKELEAKFANNEIARDIKSTLTTKRTVTYADVVFLILRPLYKALDGSRYIPGVWMMERIVDRTLNSPIKSIADPGYSWYSDAYYQEHIYKELGIVKYK